MNFSGTYPGSKIDFSIIDPQGKEISKTDLPQGVEAIEGKVYKIIKIKKPLSGMWKAKAVGVKVSGERLD